MSCAQNNYSQTQGTNDVFVHIQDYTAGSTTFELKYKSSSGSNTITVSNRRITAIPL